MAACAADLRVKEDAQTSTAPPFAPAALAGRPRNARMPGCSLVRACGFPARLLASILCRVMIPIDPAALTGAVVRRRARRCDDHYWRLTALSRFARCSPLVSPRACEHCRIRRRHRFFLPFRPPTLPPPARLAALSRARVVFLAATLKDDTLPNAFGLVLGGLAARTTKGT